MNRIVVLALAASVAAASAVPATAQPRRGAGSGQAPGAVAYPQSYPGRGYDIYSRPPGSSGTIGWNSPNASGNLGGPGAGGGGTN